MDAKKYAYAAVGAPVSVAKAALDQFQEMVEKLNEATTEMRNMATKQIDGWAVEGEKMVKRVGDTKTIDEIASKVDFESVQEQVHKLRDQLEDLMATWRSNFKPAGKPEAPKAEAPAPKPAAKPAAKKPAAKKPAAKTTAAKKPAAKPAAKKPAAKTTAAKKPAAKTTATKAS